MALPIADLHCDLLWYLESESNRTPYDLPTRCSIPQLKQGNVAFQALAVYTQTGKGSSLSGERQLAVYKDLLENSPQDVAGVHQTNAFEAPIRIALAIENASGIAEEDEPMEKVLKRLERWMKEAEPILYLSLTWNDENRFGGGNAAPGVGLKKDGETLLEFLSGKDISIDFSHTSDALAHDILNTIDRKGLKLSPIASHSNFRSIKDMPRNLPDEIAKGIFAKGGVIALNFIRAFVGKDPQIDFVRHVEHAARLGGLSQLCIGADFFYDGDYEETHDLKPFFYEHFQDSSCYPRYLTLLEKSLSPEQLKGLAHENFFSYLQKQLQ